MLTKQVYLISTTEEGVPKLPYIKSCNFVGAHLESHITWTDDIESICSMIKKTNFFINDL